VREGRFREDLYYRLNVIAVQVPPLRERRDDVPLLAEHFLALYREKNGKKILGFTRGARQLMADYDWPGNVRELENAIERAVVLSKSEFIDAGDLPREVRGAAPSGEPRSVSFAIGTPLDEIEKRVIHETLAYTKGDKRLAAQLLGIATRTIYRKLAEEAPDAEPEAEAPRDKLATPLP